MNSVIIRLLVSQGKKLAVTCGGRFHVVWPSKSEVAGSSPRLLLDAFNLREPSKPARPRRTFTWRVNQRAATTDTRVFAGAAISRGFSAKNCDGAEWTE